MNSILEDLGVFDFDSEKLELLTVHFNKDPIELDDYKMAQILGCLDFDSGKIDVLRYLIPYYTTTNMSLVLGEFDFGEGKMKAMEIMREGKVKSNEVPERKPRTRPLRTRPLRTRFKSNRSNAVFSNIDCSGFSTTSSGTTISTGVSSMRHNINLPNDRVFSLLDINTSGQVITTPDSFKCEEIEIRNGKVYCDGKDVDLDLESLDSMDWKDFRLLAKNTVADQAKITGEDEKVKGDSERCVICLENSKKCAAIPCGHKMFCIKCSNKLIDANNKSCPICRKNITSFTMIYE